jgi:hypothetical protein
MVPRPPTASATDLVARRRPRAQAASRRGRPPRACGRSLRARASERPVTLSIRSLTLALMRSPAVRITPRYAHSPSAPRSLGLRPLHQPVVMQTWARGADGQISRRAGLPSAPKGGSLGAMSTDSCATMHAGAPATTINCALRDVVSRDRLCSRATTRTRARMRSLPLETALPGKITRSTAKTTTNERLRRKPIRT